MKFSQPLSVLPGVGPKRSAALAGIGIRSLSDLLWHMPIRYEDRRRATPLAAAAEGKSVLVRAVVRSCETRRARNRNVCYATLEVLDDSGDAEVVLFGDMRAFAPIRVGSAMLLYGAPMRTERGLLFKSPDYFLLSGDRGTAGELPGEWCRILPVYPTTGAISRKWLGMLVYKCITSPDLEIADPIPPALLKKYAFPSLLAALRGIHVPTGRDEILAARRRLAYQEFFEGQLDVLAERRKRGTREAPLLASGETLQEKYLSSLPFTLTTAQANAMREIVADLDRPLPMRRLLQGDVGSGKTVVALAAAARCVGAGHQAAILAPTSILAEQLYTACLEYLAPLGISVAGLFGGMAKRERNDLCAEAAAGRVDVVVGTHALLEADVAFSSLGLAVIDEQQRFGVAQRALLSGKGRGVHTLMMSATPIPRTLCMVLYGDTDSSVIREKPAGRKPVLTRIVSDNQMPELYRFLREQIAEGGRCYWVCPAIGAEGESGAEDEAATVAARAALLERHLPALRIARLHGRMSAEEKAEAVSAFAVGRTSVLVSTTVIEIGLDVPEANLMVVESAASFGLSQLHQMRGRIGRGDRGGVCILLDARENLAGNRRLGVLRNCDNGFAIAEEDLKLRGAGELTGVRQHGMRAFKVADPLRDLELLENAHRDAIDLNSIDANYN